MNKDKLLLLSMWLFIITTFLISVSWTSWLIRGLSFSFWFLANFSFIEDLKRRLI